MRFQFPFLLCVFKKINYRALSAYFGKLITTNSCPKTTNSWYFSIKTYRKTQKHLVVSSFLLIFAEDKLHSAICKQAYIALVCIIFATDKAIIYMS